MTPNELANAIRALAMDAVEKAASGHPGMPMGMADVATVLFTRFLKFDAADPAWPDRDRFVLSAGHGSMLLYALLHLTGYASVSLDDIRGFRQIGARTPGHPEFGHTPGVETTTGPLGQGLATAVGMALAERMLAARFGPSLVDHRTWVIASDGDLMEGVSHEAGALAGHLGLGRLIVLWDDNGISIDGPTSLAMSDDHRARFRSYGWHVLEVDGHDHEAIAAAMAAAVAAPQPSLIACRTTIAYGAPTKAGTAASHGAPLGAKEIEGARAALGWTHGPFEIPADILSAWRQAGSRGAEARAGWQARLAGVAAGLRDEFERRLAGSLPVALGEIVADLKRSLAEERPKVATRQSSLRVIEALAPHLPELAGGSADLSGSNLTLGKGMAAVSAADGYAGSYVYFGVREHGMAAALNGMALHGGFVPYGGTFFVFTDYCRPAIRLSALMGVRVVYVMTHDSIGLGEDGPTHQPVEHLASLRAMPNILVLRPADTVETAECWALALQAADRPSVLVLSRQALPAVRLEHVDENLCARGAYVLAPADGQARVTLIGTGSEVSLALEARDLLQAEGVPTAVVSMPCWSLFDAQSEDYRAIVLPADTVKVAVEAASSFGWERYVGRDGGVVGLDGFGASAPAGRLYEHFGITAKAVAAAAKARLGA